MFRLKYRPTRKRRGKQKKHITFDGSSANEDVDLLNSNFPYPEFLDEGILATDGNRYHQKAKVEGEDIRLSDSVLVLITLDDNKTETCCGLVLKLWETPDKEKYANINWYWKRFEIPEELQEYILKREVLLSECIQDVLLDSIKHKVTIYDSPDKLKGKANIEAYSMTDEFFCNRGYFFQQSQFVALSTIRRLLKLSQDEGVEPVEGQTKYDVCISKLQLNRTNIIRGRENEMKTIKDLLKSMLMKKGNGSCMYISGVPGTGKTLCVREIIRELAKEVIDGKIDDFEYYEINCMSLDETPKLYTEMWYQLVGEKLAPYDAMKYLNHLFTTDPPEKYIILLIDEIDVLLTHKQTELYCILEWATLPRAHIILICIANLMDLDQRMSPKLQSRLGKARVTFYSYKAQELQDIINSRIGEFNIFHNAALQYCCKTVANFGGDARKALGICKRSIEIFLQESHVHPAGQIKLAHVTEATKEMHNTRGTNLLNKLSELQQYFLVSFLNDSKITHRMFIPVRDVIRRSRIIFIQTHSHLSFNQDILFITCQQLIEMGIFETQTGHFINPNSFIGLKCMEHDVILAIRKIDKFRKFIQVIEDSKSQEH